MLHIGIDLLSELTQNCSTCNTAETQNISKEVRTVASKFDNLIYETS